MFCVPLDAKFVILEMFFLDNLLASTEETRRNTAKANSTGKMTKRTQKANLYLKENLKRNQRSTFRTVRVYHCAQLFYTIQHTAVLGLVHK